MAGSNKNNEGSNDLGELLKRKELQRQQFITENKKATAPVVIDLAKIGIHVDWVSDLYSQRLNYENAIPILLKWLPAVNNLDVKEDIVRALSVPWARPIAAKPLVEEYRKLHGEQYSEIKWAIANALAVVADDSVFSDIVGFVQDPSNGSSRQMLALAMANMKNPSAIDILHTLLDDEEVAGHAIIALGKLKSGRSVSNIERFLDHPKTWIRNEAKKALIRIEKANHRRNGESKKS